MYSQGQTYLYDGDGKRVAKATGSPVTPVKLYWYGADSSPVLETDASGNELFRYFYFQGLLVTREEANDWVDHYALDALGNVRWLYATNSQTPYTVGWDESDYYPFGGERVVRANSTNRYKFTSKERDPESGLDNFGARFDSSVLGRFMSPDWSAAPMGVPYAEFANPQSLNLYSYVKNNPLNATDPSGHCDVDGEHHWGWCLWHRMGFYETKKEYNQRINTERAWLYFNVATNADQRKALAGYSSSQIDNLYSQWSFALQKARCSGFFDDCETVPEAKDYTRTADGSFALYRGGWFENVTDFKVDANGNVLSGEGARGPSLFDDPARIPPRFTEISKIGELPPELKIVQRGKAGHYEIVPRDPGMSPARFIELLFKIGKEPIE